MTTRQTQAQATPEVPPEEAAWCRTAMAALRLIRSGEREPSTTVAGVRLLDRVTSSQGGHTTFYHLSHQTRERLRAGRRLPWG